MSVFPYRGLVDHFAGVGAESFRPPVGRGHGGPKNYIRWHRENGYAAYAMMTYDCMLQVMGALRDSDYKIVGANILHINEKAKAKLDLRDAYVFFKQPADAFVFMTMMFDHSYEFVRKDRKRNKSTTIRMEPVFEIWS